MAAGGLEHETRLLGHNSHGRINNETVTHVTPREGKYSFLDLSPSHVPGNQIVLEKVPLAVGSCQTHAGTATAARPCALCSQKT